MKSATTSLHRWRRYPRLYSAILVFVVLMVFVYSSLPPPPTTVVKPPEETTVQTTSSQTEPSILLLLLEDRLETAARERSLSRHREILASESELLRQDSSRLLGADGAIVRERLSNHSSSITTSCRYEISVVDSMTTYVDDRGYVCVQEDFDFSRSCCSDHRHRHSCLGCRPADECCDRFVFCVSCCMGLEHNDEFEVCRSRCRTSSNTIHYDNQAPRGSGEILAKHFRFCIAGDRSAVLISQENLRDDREAVSSKPEPESTLNNTDKIVVEWVSF